MSDAIDRTSCISHRRNVHFFVMHEDFLDVAKVSDHQYKLAAFWRVLETKYNERKIYNDELVAEALKKGLPEPETNMWIEIPYSEFEHRTLGIYKSSSFKLAAAESERLGFSQSRVQKRATNPTDPKSPKVDYKEYLFLVDVMQSVLNTGIYPTPVEYDSPLLKGYEEREKRRKEKKPLSNMTAPPVEYDMGNAETPVENDSTPLSNSTSNNIDIVSSKDNKDDIVATANADVNDAPSKKASQPILPGTPDPQEEKKDEVKPTPKKKVANTKPTTEKKPRKVLGVPDEEMVLRDEVHALINKRRGYALMGRATAKQVIDENKACIVLANMIYRHQYQNDPTGCTLEELNDEWTWITKYDKYWKQPGNIERVGGQALLQMHAQTIDKIRKHKQQTASNQANGGRQLSDLEKRNREMAARFSSRGNAASGQ